MITYRKQWDKRRFGKHERAAFNGALTTAANNQAMKSRDDMSAVIEGFQKEQGLLAAFLEATHKIDWRALHKQAPISDTPKPVVTKLSTMSVNVETHQASAAPVLPQIPPLKSPASPFVLRRANLVRPSE